MCGKVSASFMMLVAVLPAASWVGNASAAAAEPGRGETVLKPDFESPEERAKWSKSPVAKWTRDAPGGKWCLTVDVPADGRRAANMVSLPVDLTPFRGMMLHFECRAKAEGVTKPAQAYNGVKFMLHYKAPSGELWRNQDHVQGTFDWKPLGFSAPIPADATAGDLSLGLQDSTGKVWFTDLVVTVLRPRAPRRPAPDPNAPPAYKGHDLPRLRGVMAPNVFRDDDLRVLGTEWKANLIRWQLNRNWGKAGTERDLAEYDRWLDGRLDELEKALTACRKHGIMAVIDLHALPGGRDENSDLAMFHEKKYQDHFVKTWEKIARRFKDNPAVWAYDLVNEPVCARPASPGMDSLATQVLAARAVRAIDAKTTIVIEAEDWASPAAFAWLTPVDVPNVVYQVHMYVPHTYTHQGVVSGYPAAPVAYPGKIGGQEYDKEALRKILAPVREFQRAYNVHIYVGEFSAVRWAPGAARYLSDCISLFEEYGWDWSYHAYREWPGWSVEHENLPMDRQVHKPAAADTDRKKVLLEWFAKNRKPGN